MRKFMYITLVLLVIADLFLGIGLMQPFKVVSVTSQVQNVLPMGLVVLTNTQMFPLAPDGVFVGDDVSVVCNRGEWLPVLFDCVINVFHRQPVRWET